MKKNLQLTLLSLCLSLGVAAQVNKPEPQPASNKRGCGTVAPSNEWNQAFNKLVEKFRQDIASGKVSAAANYTIPVIVHVIHGGEALGTYPNITAAQVNSQINVLNADFAGTGWNVNTLAATAFSAVGAANCNIVFCLSTKNQYGQTLPEPGIDRINFNDKGWANPTSFGNSTSFRTFYDQTAKPASIWDPQVFFNIWVSDKSNSNDLLGYATFPAGAPLSGLPGSGTQNDDGIFVWTGCFGDQGTLLDPNYALGRTATHEAGHWLGLRHIGGDAAPNGDCSATDFCNDTPPQLGNGPGQNGQNYGSPAYPLNATGASSCAGAPNGSMFMNFMDYCNDGVEIMFTPDQRTRMQTAMSGGIFRTGLTASSATLCTNAAASPSAIVMMDANVCNTVAVITTTNRTTGNPIPTISWVATPSAGVTFSPSNTADTPTITFPSAGVYTITCNATNAGGSNAANKIVTVDACDVGIAKNSMLAGHISLQPNPSNGKVNVIANLSSAQPIQITVTNILGQNLTSSKHSSVTTATIELDLTNYSGGVYFITVDNGKEKIVKRLILNK